MTRSGTPRAGCGLTATEAAIMDLWDAGRSIEQIEVATGLARKIVQNAVSNYDVGSSDREREAAVRAGSMRYAAALAATGKVYA